MADLAKFNQLLRSNDYIVLEYFSYNRICTLVKVIHSLSGRIFFLSVSKKYQLAIHQDLVNHYHLTRENVQSKEYTSQQLSESYPMIQLQPTNEEIVEDISDKLKSSYKQPILLHHPSIVEHLGQLKRLKYCFRMLEYKFLLQTDQHLLQLNSDNTFQVFKIENYPKTQMHTFYVVASLEQLYGQINVIHDIIHQIERELFQILDMNQEKHNQYLSTAQIEFFVNNNSKLLQTKHQLLKTYRDICGLLAQVQQKEQACADKLRAFETQRKSSTGGNVFREADFSKKHEELSKAMQAIHSIKLQVMDKLLKLDAKIKNMYLTVDQLGFNLSLSFNELHTELYKMLSSG